MGFFIFRIILAIAIIVAVYMGYKAYEAYKRDQQPTFLAKRFDA